MHFNPPIANGLPLCDPHKARNGLSDLTPEQRQRVDQQHFATQFFSRPETSPAFEMGYVYGQMPGVDPAFVFWLYTHYNDHRENMGLESDQHQRFITDSSVVPRDAAIGRVNRVHYSQSVHIPAFLDDPRGVDYTLQNELNANPEGTYGPGRSYELFSRLVESSDSMFSPKWVSGYLRAQSDGHGGTFVVACNYMVPRLSKWTQTFTIAHPLSPTFQYVNLSWIDAQGAAQLIVPTARGRLTSSARNLSNWVTRAHASAPADYAQQLEAILSR